MFKLNDIRDMICKVIQNVTDIIKSDIIRINAHKFLKITKYINYCNKIT